MKNGFVKRDTYRKVVGSLLNSNLSSNELEVLSMELINNPEVSFQIGHLLRMSSQLFLQEDRITNFDNSLFESPIAKTAMMKIQKQRLSKKEVFELMSHDGFSDISASGLQKITLNELVLRFFESASPIKASSFLRKLGIEGEPDPYLMGIEKR